MRVSWQCIYDEMEPRSIVDDERDEVRTLRWELDVDPESFYTLQELRDMKQEALEETFIENGEPHDE